MIITPTTTASSTTNNKQDISTGVPSEQIFDVYLELAEGQPVSAMQCQLYDNHANLAKAGGYRAMVGLWAC